MAVDEINQFLLTESGRFANDILQKTIQISPWMELVQEDTWPAEMGYSINITQFGVTLPATTYSDGGAVTNAAYNSSYWTDVGTAGLDDANRNNCVPPTIQLEMGSKKTLFNLQHMALESERLCSTDLMVAFHGSRQLEAIKENLSTNTQVLMTEKFRRDYVYWCSNKSVITLALGPIESTVAGGVANADTMNFVAGAAANQALKTSPAGTQGAALTQEYLQKCWSRLVYRGAGKGALTKENGAPVFALLCSMETSRALKVQTNYRDDYRWSTKKDQLLEALGVTQPPVLGFQHIIDITPPRWNYTAGAWVKVEPYVIAAMSGGGFEAVENTSYETAAWEDSIIFHKDVIGECFPGSFSNSSGTSFEPVNYRGVWGWRNIPDETKNPDGTVGYFRGIFMLGAMPKYTNYGWVIRHARCNLSNLYAACA